MPCRLHSQPLYDTHAQPIALSLARASRQTRTHARTHAQSRNRAIAGLPPQSRTLVPPRDTQHARAPHKPQQMLRLLSATRGPCGAARAQAASSPCAARLSFRLAPPLPPVPSRALRVVAAASSSSDPSPSRPKKNLAGAPAYPGYKEEHDVSHEAFMRAFTASHPVGAVPGLQEFAAALLDRRRSIPSAAHSDPLDQVFLEADSDGDGLLSAEEVSAALRSRGVDASAEIIGRYIRCARDEKGAPPASGAATAAREAVRREEFPAFVLAMASADMHHHGPPSAAASK
jgi:hypothetical protein